MNVKPFHTSTWVFLCAVSLTLPGCYGAASFIAEAVSGLDNVNVRAAVSPGVTADDLRLVKRVSVVIGTGTSAQTISFFGVGGDLTNVMADNIALELLNLGFLVIERASLDKVLQEQGIQLSDIADPTTAAKVGRILGVDAIVLGSVATSQKMEMNTGF